MANIIARRTDRSLRRLNATNASLSDIKGIISELDTLLAPGGVLLYLDEIQYFNKKQQQSLLEFIEDGRITLIASTTENPYFYVYNALLSRSSVFEFKPVPPSAVVTAVERAVKKACEAEGVTAELEPGVAGRLASGCGGDVRKAINGVELLFAAAPRVGRQGGSEPRRRRGRHGQELHALRPRGRRAFRRRKRAHEVPARERPPTRRCTTFRACWRPADLIGAIRRLLCSASEDIGLAYPQAVSIVKACCDNALQLGLPEARLPLAQAAILLATAPKSNSVVMAIDAAMADVRKGKYGPPPRELQNVHADGAGFEREQGYLYPHDFPNHWVRQQYLPDALLGTVYYRPGGNKNEQAAKRYWEQVKGEG